jgi:hypothetical protein
MITDMPILTSMVMSVVTHTHVEVHQDKKAGEPCIPPPKRIGHPGIQICIIRRRGIVGNHRGPLVGIITVQSLGVGILHAGGVADLTTRGIRHHIQVVLVHNVLKRG